MTNGPTHHTGPRLCWAGKSGEVCTTVLPLGLWERFIPRGEAGPRGDAWTNLIIEGDNRLALSGCINGPLRRSIERAGGLRLVYMDPPFAVGADFHVFRQGKTARVKDFAAIAYRDTWQGGMPEFLSMLYERLLLARELLAPEGSLFLHCGWRTAPHARLLLDEVFGPERFLGDIVWHYTGGGRAKRWFSRKHDRLLHYAAGKRWTFNPDAVRLPYKPTSGYAKSGIVSSAGKRYLPHPDGTPADDVWDIPIINPMAAERNGYPTQKPEALLTRIIGAASNPGDLVADFFCGSGTTAAVAEGMGRKWLAVDASPLAIQATRARLAGMWSRKETARAFCVGALAETPPPPGPPFAPLAIGQCLALPGACKHSAPLGRDEFFYTIAKPRMAAHADPLGGIAIELRGFEARLAGKLRAGLGNPPRSTLIESWSVGLRAAPDFAWEGVFCHTQCNDILWSGPRPAGSADTFRTPALDLGPFTRPLPLVVSLADIFGNVSRFSFTLMPRGAESA